MKDDTDLNLSQRIVDLETMVETLTKAKAAAEKNAELLTFIAENAVDTLWKFDEQFRIVYVSPSASRITGLSPDGMEGRHLFDFLSPASVDTVIKGYASRQTLMEKGERWGSSAYTVQFINKDGVYIWAEAIVNPIFDENNKLKGYSGIARDITEQQRMEQEFFQLEAQNRAMLEAIPDMIVKFNRQGDYEFYKPPKEGQFGNEIPPLGKGVNIREVVPSQYLPRVMSGIEQAFIYGKHSYKAKLTFEDKELFVESRYAKINDDEVLVLIRDITEQCKIEESMELLRVTDSVTGIYNRSYFETDIVRIQVVDDCKIGLFICDVDGLKLINDTLGHTQGDNILKLVADILESGVHKPDYVARIGGDEFVIVVFNPTNQQMETLNQYYVSQIESHNCTSPHLPLSVSFGWAIDNNSNIEHIFKTADNNMYRTKMYKNQSVRSSIVKLMMKALEAKDHITEGHADRLGDLLENIGRKLEFSQAQLADLRLFANFHDIGKVGISESILKKPAKLTDEEVVIMRQHSEIGFRIAKSSLDLEPIAEWILYHHEHWNGDGYPFAIAGEQIPLPCRILAIVDAYDAMTSDRPYRKAMSKKDAIQEINRCTGTQFDPTIAELFINLISEDEF
ncbi:MAG: diguanylate cyclase with sensor [Firmicutes bacterium]|nr:diguanylate cyclase with sensor [Bacillota bacterium]